MKGIKEATFGHRTFIAGQTHFGVKGTSWAFKFQEIFRKLSLAWV